MKFLFNRYSKAEKKGEIMIAQEFRQKCKKCDDYQFPQFDREATDKVNKHLCVSHSLFHGTLGLDFEFPETQGVARLRVSRDPEVARIRVQWISPRFLQGLR